MSALKIVAITKERFERDIKPRLRAPYSLMPFAIWKRTASGKAMKGLYRGSELIKAGTATQLRSIARKQNPTGIDRLKRNPDRLQDAVIVVRGKKVKGKAKYDSKAKRVRVFVPQATARKVNPQGRGRLIATWRHSQDPEVDNPIRLRWQDGTKATLADFARILPNTQSYPYVDENFVEFSYEVRAKGKRKR